MMNSDTTRVHRSAHLVLTSLLAAMVASCAQGQPPNPSGGSGSSVPSAAPIDYHGFPYNIQAG